MKKTSNKFKDVNNEILNHILVKNIKIFLLFNAIKIVNFKELEYVLDEN